MAVGEEFFRGVEPSGPTVTERWALTTSCTLRLRRLLLLVNEDPFFQTLRISEQNLYTFGPINHTRQFQMELQRTAEQVIEKHIFCNEPMGNVNQIAKTVASDVSSYQLPSGFGSRGKSARGGHGRSTATLNPETLNPKPQTPKN